jgi:hypothetical protein
MRENVAATICFLFFWTISFTGANSQQVFKTTPTSVIAYLESLPDGYDANSDKYPIVIFLHGIGERGPNSTDPTVLAQYIQNVAKHGPPKHVKAGAKFPFILISPQLKNNFDSWPTWYVMEIINHVKSYLRVDERRIYLTGLSLGGGGTWWAAQDLPALFAAIAPVCGGYNNLSLACGIASENLPVWAFHGDKDTVVPYSKSLNMVNAINNCTPKPSPLAKFTLYAGVGHNAWDKAYLPDNTIHTPNVYEWLMSFTNVINRGNKIPNANAGADKITSSKTISLAGSGIDTDGSISSYVWKKVTGPAATLTNSTSASLSLSNLVVGDYCFSLQVKDNSGNTDTDYIKVTVTQSNSLPVVSAGADRVLTLPANATSIVGTATDSDGTISSYSWTKVSGPACAIAGATTATLNPSGLVEGSYVFKLTVTDNAGATASDEVALVVNPPIIPVVNAGIDKMVKLPTTSAALIGSAIDNDGTIVSYQWEKVSGPYCMLNNATTSTLKTSGLVSGSYIFKLTAKDNDGNTSSDQMTMTVDAPPVVNAGPDKSVVLPMSTSITMTGSATDADGTITKYLWSKYSGPNATVSNTGSPSMIITKLYEGQYVFKLAVTDNLGVTGIDYVTINVTSSGTVSSARTATQEEIVTEDELTVSRNNAPFFAGKQEAELKGTTVILFNESGKQIYRGLWSIEADSQLVKEKGFYFYHIVRDGKRIDSGKIYKKDI